MALTFCRLPAAEPCRAFGSRRQSSGHSIYSVMNQLLASAVPFSLLSVQKHNTSTDALSSHWQVNRVCAGVYCTRRCMRSYLTNGSSSRPHSTPNINVFPTEREEDEDIDELPAGCLPDFISLTCPDLWSLFLGCGKRTAMYCQKNEPLLASGWTLRALGYISRYKK